MDTSELKVRIFADGADEESIARLAENPIVQGFTTNPSLLRTAGISDYAAFAKRVLAIAGNRPVSFEVLADELGEMERQARIIAEWGQNSVVKIPVVNTEGESTTLVANSLARSGVAVNVTAVFTLEQLQDLELNEYSYISVFAGRIADTGVFPVNVIRRILSGLWRSAGQPRPKIIWASPREILNVIQADTCGCHAITLTPDLIAKLSLFGKDLQAYSVETVGGFYRDAMASGLCL